MSYDPTIPLDNLGIYAIPGAIRQKGIDIVTGNVATATKLATARTISISGKIIGTATSFDGSGNITIPVTAVVADSCTGNSATATTAGSCTGNAVTATAAETCTGNSATATKANPQRTDGTKMAFNWSGQSGQPPYLWGGSDGTNMYVYNPSNFSVNYATSAGNAHTANGVLFYYAGDTDMDGMPYLRVSNNGGVTWWRVIQRTS